MRVVVFTSEEPLYLPKYLEPIVSAHADVIDRIVIAPFDEPIAQQIRKQAEMYGINAGSRMLFRFVRAKFLDALPMRLRRQVSEQHHSVASVARVHDIPIERISNVNDNEFVARMRDLGPDLILSIVAGQRFSRNLLATANDAINLHGSLLPKYRGRATAFWPLYYGDDRTGVTAHRMTTQFDAGPIIAQRDFRINSNDSLDCIYRRLSATGGALAVELLDTYPALPQERPNETTEDDYHGLPGANERRVFYERGNRFL